MGKQILTIKAVVYGLLPRGPRRISLRLPALREKPLIDLVARCKSALFQSFAQNKRAASAVAEGMRIPSAFPAEGILTAWPGAGLTFAGRRLGFSFSKLSRGVCRPGLRRIERNTL